MIEALDDLLQQTTRLERRLTYVENRRGGESVFVNVRRFGATGNGTTDDTAAMQAASDAATGKVLIFPEGTYLGTFTVAAATKVVSKGATLKQPVLATNAGTPIIEVTGENVVIDGLSFDGQQASQSADGFSDSFNTGGNSTGRAFRAAIKADATAYTISNLTVRNCTFRNIYGACIATQDVSEVRIQDNTAEDCLFEMAFCYKSAGTRSSAIVTGNRAYNIGSGDGSVNANVFVLTDYDRVIFAHNEAYDFERNMCKLEGGDFALITDNIAHTNSVDNFGAFQVQSVGDRLILANNQMYNCGAGFTGNWSEASTEAIIVNNLIETTTGATTGDGILIGGNGYGVTYLRISGNIIRNVARHGINLNAVGNVTDISHNQIYGTANSAGVLAIARANTSYLQIKDNIVSGFEGTSIAGISIQRTSTYTYENLSVTGNTIIASAAAKRAFEIVGAIVNSGEVRNNQISGTFNDGASPVTVVDNLGHTTGAVTLERLQGWVTSGSQNPALGTLPANTYVANVRMQVTEAFNSDGTDTISVGYDADPDAYCTGTDVSSTGILTPTLGVLAGYNGTARAVEAYYANGGTEPTEGKALVTLEYYRVTAQP